MWTRNVADEYLKRRGWKESAGARAYIRALRTSVMSLYEVSDVVVGESFLARDLVIGAHAVVRSALKPGDGFVRATAGRVRWAQHAQTQAAIRPRGRSTRPTRRSAFVCKPGG